MRTNGVLSGEVDVWRFPGRLKRIVDGDTIDLVLDRGFRTRSDERIRLYGVDTAETYGVSAGSEEYNRGVEHKTFIHDWFDSIQTTDEYPLTVLTLKERGKYGRWLADIENPDGESVVSALFTEFGSEVAYDRS